MSVPHARSARVLDPAFVEGLDALGESELRERRDECVELETEVSYVRRLAQARIDILEAEVERRAGGGSLGDLIERLPEILADAGPRQNPATSRLPLQLAPTRDSEWAPELAASDGVLATLPSLSDDDLAAAIGALRALERDVSSERRGLHGVIDRIDLALAGRLA